MTDVHIFAYETVAGWKVQATLPPHTDNNGEQVNGQFLFRIDVPVKACDRSVIGAMDAVVQTILEWSCWASERELERMKDPALPPPW